MILKIIYTVSLSVAVGYLNFASLFVEQPMLCEMEKFYLSDGIESFKRASGRKNSPSGYIKEIKKT